MFRALAATGRALEVNTSSPLASVDQVRWFHEEGGEAVSFGSDAHAPDRGRPALRPRRRRRRGGRLPARPRPLRLLAPLSIRSGTPPSDDAEACAAIYAPVRHRHGDQRSSTSRRRRPRWRAGSPPRSATARAGCVLEERRPWSSSYAYAGPLQGARRLPAGRARSASTWKPARRRGRRAAGCSTRRLFARAGRARVPARLVAVMTAAQRGQRGPAPRRSGFEPVGTFRAGRLEARADGATSPRRSACIGPDDGTPAELRVTTSRPTTSPLRNLPLGSRG